jgi:hypothetical protein
MAAGQIYQGGATRISYDGKTLYHTKSCKLQISTKMEEIATKDTNGTVSTPSNYAWSLSAESLVADIPSGSTTQIGFMDIVALQLAKTLLTVEVSDGVAGSWIASGSVYVESADVDMTVDQSVSGSFSFKGNGDLTIDTIGA